MSKGDCWRLERLLVAWVWCLSFSRSARSVSFLHSKLSSSSSSSTRRLQQQQQQHQKGAASDDVRSWRPIAPRRSNSSWWNVVSPLAAVVPTVSAPTSNGSSNSSRTTTTTATTTAATSTPSNNGFFSPFTSLTTLTRRQAEAVATANVQETNTSSSSSTATIERGSVHLGLRETQEPSDKNKNKSPSPTSGNNNSKSNLKIHTYVDGRGRTWKSLNTPRDKFEAFLRYHNLSPTRAKITTVETTTAVPADTAAKRRQEWRSLWKKGQLLTERTEYLAVYPSDDEAAAVNAKLSSNTGLVLSNKASLSKTTKRGGFADLLYLYTQRLLSFLKDEQQDKKSLLRWLQKEYGRAATARLQADALQQYPAAEQIAYWKEFLEWFREKFPYYYDRCSHCGASIREDVVNNVVTDNSVDQSKGGHKTFLGYVYPQEAELTGKASRTELYQCHKCQSFTRFPRFNAAWHVMEHGRGRCGEYSMLLFRFLRALGHESRWVVDWADHVWTEVYCSRSGDWIHLDPCEAAVQENLLYQSWGKKQTFVLGFYAPLQQQKDSIGCVTMESTPLIEDITMAYTTDTQQQIQARRDESEQQVQAAMEQSIAFLRQRLDTKVYDE